MIALKCRSFSETWFKLLVLKYWYLARCYRIWNKKKTWLCIVHTNSNNVFLIHDCTKTVFVFKISLIHVHFFQLNSNTFDWQPVAWWPPVSVCSSSRWSGTSGRTWGCPVCLGQCLPWVGMPWTSCPLNCSPPMSGTETLPPLTWLYITLPVTSLLKAIHDILLSFKMLNFWKFSYLTLTNFYFRRKLNWIFLLTSPFFKVFSSCH